MGAVLRSVWVRALITAAVLAWAFSRIDLGDTWRALTRLSPAYAIAVLAIVAVDRLTMVWRWIILLRATGHTVRAKSALWIYLVSSFVGSLVSIGADVARAYTLSQRTSQGSDALASVAVDRLIGLVSLVVLAIAGYAAWSVSAGGSAGTLLVASGISVIACAGVLWADTWIRALLPIAWHHRSPGRRVLRLADALSRYRAHRGALGAVMLLSIAVQLLRISQAYLLARGIGIDQAPFAYYLAVMPVALVGLQVPVSLGGFGAPQMFIVWLLRPVGVPTAEALALSTLIVLTGHLSNLPGAWLYLRSRRTAD
jgi:uncharacterized membrane protein YbhN (UPF0104 family)